MQAAGGAIACKGGAEGIHGVSAIPQGIGYASKALDGGGRARGPSTIAALQRLGVINEDKASELQRYGRPAVYNRAGRPVGEIRAK
jgi:L-asparaginase II